MLYLTVANNVKNNYCSCQSLYDFIQLSLINTIKEPTRLLNKKCALTNNFVPIKKKRICLDYKRYLNLETSGHRESSNNCPFIASIGVLPPGIFKKNTYFKSMVIFIKKLSNKIKLPDKDWLKRYMINLLIFYSVKIDHLHLVRCNYYLCNISIFLIYLTQS